MKFTFLFFVFHLASCSLFDECNWGVIELTLQCGGIPYEGQVTVQMYDKDTIFDEIMAEVTEEMSVGASGRMFINGTVKMESCDTVQPYLKITSTCKKELDTKNYGIGWVAEKARRAIFAKPVFEVCRTLPTDRQERNFIIELATEKYCGLSEM